MSNVFNPLEVNDYTKHFGKGIGNENLDFQPPQDDLMMESYTAPFQEEDDGEQEIVISDGNGGEVLDYDDLAGRVDEHTAFKSAGSVFDYSTQLSDGSLIPKYERYFGGSFDEDDFYGRHMSTGEKWARGGRKFVTKNIIRTVGNLADMVYGAGAALVNWDSSYIYDNSLTRVLDDFEKIENTRYANYRTKEERNMGNWEKMLTANFWADDMLDTTSFVTSAIMSEGIMATLTGGTSLGASLARGVLKRMVMKKGAKLAVGEIAKDAFRYVRKGMIKKAFKAGNIAHTVRFAATSGSYESITETYAFKTENIDNWYNSYVSERGQSPSAEEMVDFIKEVDKDSMGVLGANMVVTGTGNALLLGKMAGLDKFLGKGVFGSGRAIKKKLFGNYVKEVVEEVGEKGAKKMLYKVAPNKAQKILGRVVSSTENIVEEGFQEGLQGAISNMGSMHLMNEFNPTGIRQNIETFDMAMEAMKEAFLTEEGFGEVLVGGLVGGITSVGGRAINAARGQGKLFGTSWGDKLRESEKQVQQLNDSASNIFKAFTGTEDTARRLLTGNSITDYVNKSQQYQREGNKFMSDDAFKSAVFKHMSERKKAGLDEMNNEETSLILDGMEEDLKKQGLSVEEIASWKKDAFKQMKDWSAEVEDVYELGEALGLDNYNKIAQNPLDIFAQSVFMGRNSYDQMLKMADEIKNLNPNSELMSSRAIIASMDEKVSKSSKEILSHSTEIEKLEGQLKDVVGKISSAIQSQDDLKDGAAGERVFALKEKQKELVAKIQEVEAKREEARKRLQLHIDTKGVHNGEYIEKVTKRSDEKGSTENALRVSDLESSVKETAMLRGRMETLKKLSEEKREQAKKESNPKKKKALLEEATELEDRSSDLGYKLKEFESAYRRLQDYNRTARMVADPRFMRSSFSGWFKPLRKLGVEFSDEELNDVVVGEDYRTIESEIKKKEKKLSEDDIYTMRALARMITDAKLKSLGNQDRLWVYVRSRVRSGGNWYQDNNLLTDVAKLYKNEPDNPFFKNLFEPLQTDSPQKAQNKLEAKKALENRVEEIKKEEEEGVSSEELIRKYNLDSVNPKDLELDDKIKDFKQKLLNLIQKGLSGLFVFKDEDQNVSSYEMPTVEEVEEFIALREKVKNGETLDEEDAEKFNKMENEFKNIVLAYGALTGAEGATLGEIIDVFLDLDSGEGSGHVEAAEVLEKFEDLAKQSGLETEKRNRAYQIAQVYDKAVVSAKDGNLIVHNVSLDRLIEELKTMYFDVLPLQKEGGGVKLICLTDKGTQKDIEVEIDDLGNILFLPKTHEENGKTVVDKTGAEVLMEDTLFRVGSMREGAVRNYDPLYVENTDGSLRLVDSDFEAGNGTQMDVDAVYELQKGDGLQLEVDLSEGYNQKLIDDYNSAMKSGDKTLQKQALSELFQQLKILMIDSQGRIVGVLKGANTASIDDESAQAVRDVRKKAVDYILKVKGSGNNIKGKVLLNDKLKVSRTFLGFPKISLRTEGDGSIVVEKRKLNDNDRKAIKNVGYMLNGKLHLRNKEESVSKGVDTKSMMGKIFVESQENGMYHDKKIPVMVVEFNGKLIAYPLEFKKSMRTFGEAISVFKEDVKNNKFSKMQRIKILNKLLTAYGLIDKYGSIDEYSESELDQIALDNYDLESVYADFSEKLLDINISEDKIFDEMVLTNLKDVDNNPFHSPKFSFDIEKGDDGVAKFDREKEENPLEDDEGNPVSEDFDRPSWQRKRGWKKHNGVKYERAKPKTFDKYTDIKVGFGVNDSQKGKSVLMEAEDLVPSHERGSVNPRHFMPEAQPKDRSDGGVSEIAAQKIAREIDPRLIVGSTRAYEGSPCVNSRGEVIQGNNRSYALRMMYLDGNYTESAQKYKEYLAEHAEDFGLTREEVLAMKNPIAVNVLNVTDDRAIYLGQRTVSDFESGGNEVPIASQVANSLKDGYSDIVGLLMKRDELEEDVPSLSSMIDRNGFEVIDRLRRGGHISDTAANNMLKNVSVNDVGRNFLKDFATFVLFKDSTEDFKKKYNSLPEKVKKIINLTVFHNVNVPKEEQLVGLLENAIVVLSKYGSQIQGSNHLEALEAITKNPQGHLFGESIANFENGNAVKMAVLLKYGKQREMINSFNNYYGDRKTILQNMMDFGLGRMSSVEALNKAFYGYGIKFDDSVKSISSTNGQISSANSSVDIGNTLDNKEC